MKWLIRALILATALVAPMLNAETYNAAADFPGKSNPNGVWRYGWSVGINGTLNLYPMLSDYDGFRAIVLWSDPLSMPSLYIYPNVMKNVSDVQVVTPGGTAILEAHDLALNALRFSPDDLNRYSVVAWTAPKSGLYTVKSTFVGANDGCGGAGTSSDAHVLINGNDVFSYNILGYRNAKSFSRTVSLNEGDVISFAIGSGDNGNSDCDTVALSAIITSSGESFSTFTPRAEFTLGSKANDDAYWVRGWLKLADTSNGINPLTEAVTVKVGPFSHTVPAGSFNQEGDSYVFKGPVGASVLDVRITGSSTPGGYSFKSCLKKADLEATTLKPDVQLTIGDDSGQATLDVGYAKFGKGSNGKNWVFPPAQ